MSSNNSTRRLLILTNWYKPGFRAGGIITTMTNFVGVLRNDFEIFVVTGDRDHKDNNAYQSVRMNEWIRTDGSTTYYAGPGHLTFRKLKSLMLGVRPDIILLNGVFPYRFTILPLLVLKFGVIRSRVFLLPHGMLMASALQFKSQKKRLFLWIFRVCHFHKDVIFLCSTVAEEESVKAIFGAKVQTVSLPHFTMVPTSSPRKILKMPGMVRLIFIGRIHPIKNLATLLTSLVGLSDEVFLTIVGQVEDEDYLRLCMKIVEELSPNITVQFVSEVAPQELHSLIGEHHFLALPTTGENFGYAIFECLCLGRPVIISDQTPWRNLKECKVGWDVSLNDIELYRIALTEAISQTQVEYSEWQVAANNYAHDFVSNSNLRRKYFDLLLAEPMKS